MDIATDMDALRAPCEQTEIDEIIDLVKAIVIKWETYQASLHKEKPSKTTFND